MKFVDKAIDIGAPEYVVAGIASVERISENMIRVTYCSRRPEGDIVPVHIVWDRADWRRACELIGRACESILAEVPRSGADDHPSRLAH